MTPRKAIEGILAAAAMGLSLSAAPALGAELRVELSKLLRKHPDIRAAANDLSANGEAVGVAKSALLPILSLTAETGFQTINNSATRRGGTQDDFDNRKTSTLALTQPLYDGNAARINVGIAELNRKLSAISLEGMRQQTLLDGVEAYIEVLRRQRLVKLFRESEDRISRQLNLEDERVRRGSGITVDVLTAKARLQTAKERRVNAEGQFKNALHTFLQIYGFPANPEWMFDPVPPVDAIPSSLERAIAIAKTEHPAVRTAAANIEVAVQEEKSASVELFPTVDLETLYTFEQNESGSTDTERDLQFNVTASWDLFSGFSTPRTRAQRGFETGAERDRRLAAAAQVEEQTRLSWENLQTVRKRVALLENAVNIASEVAVSRRRLREAGRETVLNVLDAENEVNNAQIDFTTAAYDERLFVYQLLLAMGRLDALTLDLQVAALPSAR